MKPYPLHRWPLAWRSTATRSWKQASERTRGRRGWRSDSGSSWCMEARMECCRSSAVGGARPAEHSGHGHPAGPATSTVHSRNCPTVHDTLTTLPSVHKIQTHSTDTSTIHWLYTHTHTPNVRLSTCRHSGNMKTTNVKPSFQAIHFQTCLSNVLLRIDSVLVGFVWLVVSKVFFWIFLLSSQFSFHKEEGNGLSDLGK